MIISMWFCRSGFGPGPSAATGTVRKGFAGPAIRKLKNVAQPSHVPIACGM